MSAHFLSKMVGMASFKRERVRFDNYSTSTCGLRRKNPFLINFFRQGFSEPVNKINQESMELVRVVDRKMKKKREGAYIFLFQRDKNTVGGLYEKRST